MRLFPRAPRPRASVSPRPRASASMPARVVAALTVAGLGLGAVLAPAAFADDLKQQKNKVERRIGNAKHDLEESSARASRATAKLERSQAELDGARDHLAAVRVDLDTARVRDEAAQRALTRAVVRLKQARADVVAGKRRVERQRRDVEDMVISIYREGDPDLLTFESLLNAETPSELATEQTVRDALVDDQSRIYDQLRAAKVLLEVREDQVQDARDRVRQRRREAAVHLAAVQDLERQAVVARDDVRGLVAEDRTARRQARRVRAADAQVLQQLRAEEARIQAELRRRALAALRRARAAKQAAERATAQRSSSSGFLSRPSAGYVSSGFGYRIHPIYGYYGLHNGTDFSNGGACGGPLLAAADGTVMSSDYSSVYGNRLYLDHGLVRGRGLVSVYNHASSYTVSPGQRVSRGQVIGYMGSTGWSTGCHLHFSVLANGRYVDPLGWM